MKIEIESLDELRAFLAMFQPAPVMFKGEATIKLQPDDSHVIAEPANGVAAAGEQTEGATRRKRRTKAEIEADAAAQQTKIVDEVATESASAEAPNETNETSSVDETQPPAASPAQTDDVTHLKLCREFIQQHGMPKYNESFTLSGLSNNIMSFTAEQRAQHLAALQQLSGA